jgi:hypothetical protein
MDLGSATLPPPPNLHRQTTVQLQYMRVYLHAAQREETLSVGIGYVV